MPARLLGITLVSFAAAGHMAIAGPSNGIMGIWQRGDGAARIRMDPCGDKICATNIWIRNPARQNEHVGDKLIFRIKPNGNDWIGEAYDPQRHLSMSAKLMPSGDTMISTGCVLGGIICRSSRWARIETAPQR